MQLVGLCRVYHSSQACWLHFMHSLYTQAHFAPGATGSKALVQLQPMLPAEEEELSLTDEYINEFDEFNAYIFEHYEVDDYDDFLSVLEHAGIQEGQLGREAARIDLEQMQVGVGVGAGVGVDVGVDVGVLMWC